MTSVFQTGSCRGMSLNLGLALALLAGQMSAQAAANGVVLPAGASTQVPDLPEAADNSKVKEAVVLPEPANKEGPVIVTTDKVKTPAKQRQIKLGKVKPEKFSTKPQQVVKALR